MRQALRASDRKRKRAVVEQALRLLVRTNAQLGIRRLRGKGRWQGDLASSRTGRVAALRGDGVIVDTSGWVDFLNDVDTAQTRWLDQRLPEQRLGLLDVIVCEVLQGLSAEDEAAEVLQELRHFEIFETGGLELAVAAARNYRSLRRRGKTVRKTLDCLIATFCLTNHHALLHCDGDFDPFEKHLGLKVV